ncbi:pyrroloquinoline quinone biosynthesis protein PqqB [Spongiactinospora sp. 9N601]|uniref:pyrroloquinoline quinone biosynthesis protein PqqB n=1 Tax=Spongiactinospora sp. 9N601 TaxID=3375149 RepID=UPI003796CDB1
MRLQVLGTAAGGGVPQWNCACPGCHGARADPRRRRRHASLALEVAPGRSYVVNATPDLGEQIESCPWLLPAAGTRETPLSGVLLTDAELDHTLGIPRLREADKLEIWATPAVGDAVGRRLGLDGTLAPYVTLDRRDLQVRPVALGGTVEVAAVPLSAKRPRYATPDGTDDPAGAWVVALVISDRATGRSLLYAPAMGTWPAGLDDVLRRCDVVLIDGTFWDDDEPRRSGASSRTATQMGHLPIVATAPRLAAFPGRVLYTHLNNTNPLVDPDAPEHAELEVSGARVAAEGTVIEL